MKYFKYIFSITLLSLSFASCNKDVLDRPPLTSIQDGEFWRNEEDLRIFGNGFYPNFFNGYATGFVLDYTPVRGSTFSDDLTSKNVQANFESSVPASRASTSEAGEWMLNYGGPTWNFSWIRKANLFLDRIETVAKPNISAEALKHWTAVARFFRGYEYTRLVSVFGDVPYFDKAYSETDLPALYRDRDSRGVVMDKVYEDFQYVLANMRESDGVQSLNRYMAAGFISRFMLFEGTFEHYHGLDAARAKKYLELARDAAEYVINSGKYNFTKDFKSLFSSESLAGHPEVLLYRTYDAALGVTHSTQSYQNGTEIVGSDANLGLMQAFLLSDGKVWQNSALVGANSFKITDLVRTRDPRFEASFIDKANGNSATLLYGYKFASREAITYIGKSYPSQYGSNTNSSDAPVLRYAEVVLNWIEAKAVLKEHFGGAAVTQADINKSINAIRNRPLEAAAIAKGVQKTAALDLLAIPVDIKRDADVPELIWEIRRERRMEFVFEPFRLLDIKRWKKLTYMNFDLATKPQTLLGPWVDVPAELPTALTAAAATAKNVKVMKADASGNPNGVIVTYDGTNAAAMVGFWMPTGVANRAAFTDRAYLSPVGQNQITQYAEKGYKLTQTKLW